jgi:hypothetical protein
MKATLTVLFSALLLIGQCILPESAAASATQKCGRCDCGMRKCCLNTALPDSNPSPTAPSPNRSLKQFQSAVILLTPILASSASQSRQVLCPFSSPRRPQAVPFYDRNCAWLI